MSDRWGQITHIGGMAGLPFSGRTGWTTAMKHLPDYGNMIVFYAPHVFISKEGIIGRDCSFT